MPANTVPTKLKILRSTDQPCRTNQDEPEPSQEGIEPPKNMSRKALKKWKEVVEVLKDCRVMTVADIDALRTYSEAFVMFSEAAYTVNTEGGVIQGDGGPMVNSAIKVMKIGFDQMMPPMRELGLTPASRTKVSAVGKKKKTDGFNSF